MVKTLYVGNVSWGTTEEELRDAFAKYGEVLGCRIITERATGRSRGYGFVEVNDEDAEKIKNVKDAVDYIEKKKQT